MTKIITGNEDGTCTIAVDYADEGIELQGTTTIIGGEAKATAYIGVFDEDLRRNNSHLFPTPEPAEHEEEF